MKHKNNNILSPNIFRFNLLFVLLFLHGWLNAQENFVPGTIITNQDDTLQGLIDFRDWADSPETFRFKKSRESVVQTFTPHTLKSVSVENTEYICRQVIIDKTPVDLWKLGLGYVQLLEKDTIALKAIVVSEVGISLYSYSAKEKNHFFAIYGDSIVELLYIYYYDEKLKSGIKNAEYKNQLARITKKCPKLLGKIDRCRFTSNEIASIIIDFNKCEANDISYQFIKPKTQEYFGLMVGVSKTKITFTTGDSGPGYGRAEYSYGNGYNAGLFYDLDFEGRRQTLWLNTELVFNKFSSHGFAAYTSGSFYREEEINFDILDALLTMALKVQMNTPKFKPYFKIGFGGTYSITNDNTQEIMEENIYIHTIENYTLENEIDKNNFHVSFIAGGGVTLMNKYYLEVLYDRALTIAGEESVKGFQDAFSLHLKYAF